MCSPEAKTEACCRHGGYTLQDSCRYCIEGSASQVDSVVINLIQASNEVDALMHLLAWGRSFLDIQGKTSQICAEWHLKISQLSDH